MSDIGFVILIVLIGIAALVARYYWARYQEGRPKSESAAITLKPSTLVFLLAVIAFCSAVAKPASIQVSNYIILGVIAALVVFGVILKRRE